MQIIELLVAMIGIQYAQYNAMLHAMIHYIRQFPNLISTISKTFYHVKRNTTALTTSVRRLDGRLY